MWPEIIKDEWKQAPAGDIVFSIDGVARLMKSATRGNATVETAVEQVELTVVEPDNYEGIKHTQLFWLGSDQDPQALQAETLSRGGASKFKAFAGAIDVAVEGQDEEYVRSMLKDQRIGGHVNWKVTADGFTRANITSWFKPGDKPTLADEDTMKAVREQAQSIQTAGGGTRGGALPPRLANRGGAPLPPSRPAGAFTSPQVGKVIGR